MENSPYEMAGGRQSESLSFAPHQRVDQYEILEPIGMGGMGAVFKAKDTLLRRLAAIKVMQRSALQGNAIKRFEREIEVSARLSHSYIVKIYHVGTVNHIPYLAMEYIDGLPLLAHVEQNNLSWENRLLLLQKVSYALEYAHAQKVIHRDIKPSNILVRKNGEPVLMDFGLAKSFEVSDRSITRSGEVIGTPQYMAPEQAEGLKRKTDVRTDVYGMGAVLYHLLTGKPPASGESLMEILYQVAKKKPASPRALVPEVPEGVEKICLKALEKNKNERYPTAQAMGDDISAYLAGKPTEAERFYRARKWLRSVCVLLAFLLLLASGGVVHSLASSWKNGRSWEEKIDPFERISKLYEEGKKEKSLENANVLFSKAIDMIEKGPGKNKSPSYADWKRKIHYALLENYYGLGREKLEESPEEARIFLSRASDMLQKLDRPHPSLMENIRQSLLRAYFYSGDYRSVCEFEKTVSSRDIEIDWLVAQAAYHCEREDAFARLERLERESPEKDVKHLGSIFFQAMIRFHSKDFRKAKDLLEKSITLAERIGAYYGFQSEICLYYCASILFNVHENLESKIDVILHYLSRVGKEHHSSAVYQETRARYNLLVLKKGGESPENSFALAQEIVRLMDECIRENREKSDYYLLRGNAYKHLKKYEQSISDLSVACEMESGSLDSFMAMHDLLSEYAVVEDFSEYSKQSVQYLGKLQNVEVDLFSPEFDALRREYISFQFNVLRGIPFQEKIFQKLYTNLYSESSELRHLSENTIVSIAPLQDVLHALRQKQEKEPQKEKTLESLKSKIEREIQKKEEQNILMRLIHVSSIGYISPVSLRYFAPHVSFLQKILEDHEGKLCPGKSESWTLVRYLSARALAHMDSMEINRYLLERLQERTTHISTRIVTSRAIHETGRVFFDKTSLHHYAISGDDEFLKCLTTECIAPTDENATRILLHLLNTEFERVRVTAAFRLTLSRNAGVVSRAVKASTECCSSKNNHVRALAVLTIWSEEFCADYFERRGKTIPPDYFSRLMNALGDESQLVQRAAFLALTNISQTDIQLDTAPLIPIVRKILQGNPSPVMRYQSIIALGTLVDEFLFSEIGTNPNASLLDKTAFVNGIGRNHRKMFRYASKLLECMKKTFVDNPDKRLRGYMTFCVCRYFEFLAKISKTTLSQTISESLDDPDPVLRFYSTLAIPYIPDVPSSIVEKVQKTWNSHPNIHIHVSALSSLVSVFYRQKSPRLDKMHAWAKTTMSEERDKVRIYRLGVVFGYSQIFMKDIECTPRWYRWLGSNADRIRHHEMNTLKKCAQDPSARKKYIDCLERIVDIMETIWDENPRTRNLFKNYVSLLCGLYVMDGQEEKAAKMLFQKCEQYEWKDGLLAAFWARMMRVRGKSSEALKKLQEILPGLPQNDFAIVSQAMAAIHLHQKNYALAENLFHEQYWFNPRMPSSLIALGEYYCSRQQYDQAFQIFSEAVSHFKYLGDAYFGLARVCAFRRDFRNTVLFLEHAAAYNYFHSLNQLDRCPEFRNLPDLKDRFRKIPPPK